MAKIKKPEVIIDINTGKPTTDWATGKRLLSFLTTFDDRLVPQFLDNWGVKRNFESVDACEPHWSPRATMKGGPDNYYYDEFELSITFTRKRVAKYRAKLDHTSQDRSGGKIYGWLSFKSEYHEAINWSEFFIGLCDILGSSSAKLHCFTNGEKRWSLVGRARFENIPHHLLVPAKYVQEQTKDSAYYIEDDLVQKISDKGFSIEKFNDGYLIKVSDKLEDVLSDYETFSRRRDELKSLFPPGVFRGLDPV